MTTSFSVTRDDIIKAALRTCGIIGLKQTPDPDDITYASQALNIMIKGWQTKGATLWKIQELVLPLVANQSTYKIGPTAGRVLSVTVNAGGTGYVDGASVTFSAPPGFSGYSGTTATGTLVVSGGVITGVTLTSGGSGYLTAPTITAPTGTGASFTVNMIGLTTQRPLRVLDQGNFLRNTTTNKDTPVEMLSRSDYELYGRKDTASLPNSFFFDPAFSVTDPNTVTRVYPEPIDNNRELHLFAQMTFEDVAAGSDTFDFPQEWFAVLKYGLARELVIEYGVDEATERRIEKRFAEAMGDGLGFSVEEAATYFTVDTRGGR